MYIFNIAKKFYWHYCIIHIRITVNFPFSWAALIFSLTQPSYSQIQNCIFFLIILPLLVKPCSPSCGNTRIHKASQKIGQVWNKMHTYILSLWKSSIGWDQLGLCTTKLSFCSNRKVQRNKISDSRTATWPK